MTLRGLLNRLVVGLLVVAIALLTAFTAPAPAAASDSVHPSLPELMVYRSPTCRCCGHWVDHMKAAGFEVQDVVTEVMAAIKAQYGVPEALASCHTALVDDYVIEGHVPATDVQRLLSEEPDVLGIAAPGMPVGSPGMEMGDRVDSYTVVSFTQAGDTAPFAQHP
ncbi:metal-binding protein [filamentous cyanobacterium CCT1]|nr:metal-binding protein [filamentous cyanobacterium CCT1]PSN76973.1 metal-binding protein [filamentous cyanobacterium CCP4]